jgi:hypothetical protein
MRQDGVVLAAQPVASQPVASQPVASQPLASGLPTEVSFTHHQTVAVTEHQTGGVTVNQSGTVAVVATPAEIPAASVTASAAASPTLATEARGDSGNPPMLVSLTLLPLPVQPEQLRAEREPNRNRGGKGDGDSESGLSGRSDVRRVGRMLRGQVDLGHRGQLNFEIRSLNGRFSVALGATPGLGAAARPVLPVLEEALHRLPGFTELHWNG